MADEITSAQTPAPPPAKRPTPTWLLFVFPALLAVIGGYFALTRPAPNAAQRAAQHAGPLAPESAQPRP